MSAPITYQFSLSELNISLEEVINIITGGKEKESVSFYIDLLKEELHHFTNYEEIHGGYVVKENIQLEKETKTVKIDDKIFSLSNIIFNELKTAEKIIVFTCTAGKPFCDYAKNMYKTDIMKGYLLEMLANSMVETAMDKIQDKMKEDFAKEGLLVSNRYSPGYCDWNVSEQQKLFQLLPNKFCGVTLSDTSLMSPIKSISGFIGIGKNIKYQSYKCKTCKQANCIYRSKLSQT